MPELENTSSDGDGIPAHRAAVVPRGHRRGCQASLPIEQLLLPVIRSVSRGIILISGSPGSGKTTALRHLQAVLAGSFHVIWCDAHEVEKARKSSATGLVVLAATDLPSIEGGLEFFQLSRWTLDDCLEYLHTRHRARCASVLSRLGGDKSFSAMEGSPRLLTLVMDRMAADESLHGTREILRQHVRQILPTGAALDRLVIDGPAHAPLNAEQWRWWRHPVVENICRADWIVARLNGGVVPIQLFGMDDSVHLIGDIAAALNDFPEAKYRLICLIESDRRSTAIPMAASILLANDPNWRPADARGLMLSKARLAGARWSGLDLAGAFLFGTNLSRADLSGADLKVIHANGADFSGADLKGAQLKDARMVGASLVSADLSGVSATRADFSDANLASANLHHADLTRAVFAGAIFTAASAMSANFSGASMPGVELRQANFTGANFTSTAFTRIDFSETNLSGVCFAKASLLMCNLEWLEMPGADFTGANLHSSLLTGTRIIGGQFTGANLCKTGLAEIHWENADLRNADLTDASFHMGSTRSGLVGSTIAGEGSRTGFYTDDFNDQSFKSPEEIRKACLCGSNLLGAVVEQTDFYLVDLRDAIYSESQARHFSASGAIL